MNLCHGNHGKNMGSIRFPIRFQTHTHTLFRDPGCECVILVLKAYFYILGQVLHLVQHLSLIHSTDHALVFIPVPPFDRIPPDYQDNHRSGGQTLVTTVSRNDLSLKLCQCIPQQRRPIIYSAGISTCSLLSCLLNMLLIKYPFINLDKLCFCDRTQKRNYANATYVQFSSHKTAIFTPKGPVGSLNQLPFCLLHLCCLSYSSTPPLLLSQLQVSAAC